MKYLYLIAGLLLIASCKTYSEEDLDTFDQQIQAYLKKENISCTRSETGLFYKIIEPGSGAPVLVKDKVQFTYKGTFMNGKIFDEQKEPVAFNVNELIAAWKEIVLKLKVGGSAFLVTPPQLAYGERKLNDIPAGSILIYELTVTDVN